jgi:hypothetical protein
MLCERDLTIDQYSHVVECDWTSGSFMLARRVALESAAFLDERFFIYSEGPDLCLRTKRAGWKVCHVPKMTIVHHAGRASDCRCRGAPLRQSGWFAATVSLSFPDLRDDLGKWNCLRASAASGKYGGFFASTFGCSPKRNLQPRCSSTGL